MAAKAKSWGSRLNQSKTPVVKLLEIDFAGLKSGTTMLVSSPQEVEAYINQLPFGTARTITQMRADLAQQHAANGTCPVSTAIFLRVVAEAALEQLDKGTSVESITPFWRVVDPADKVAKKLTCGPDFVKAQRAREGIQA
jgi:hypothetical protein